MQVYACHNSFYLGPVFTGSVGKVYSLQLGSPAPEPLFGLGMDL